jgi:hypothetical protein
VITEILHQYVAAARPDNQDDRASTVGASDVGKCERQVYFGKHFGDPVYGSPRDPDFVDRWGARERGSVFEHNFWLPAMRARFGEKLLYAGDQQRTFRQDFLSATPDGLVIDLPRNALATLKVADIGGDGSLLVECKTRDPRARMDAPQPAHIYQVNVQLGLFRALTTYRPQYALLFYADASFWDETREFVIPLDFDMFKNAQQRAARIMLAKGAHELKPEGYIAGGHECEHCPFTKACAVLRSHVPKGSDKQIDPQFAAEIADRAREVKKQQADVEAATEKLRALQYEIKDRLRDKGLRKVEADGAIVTWSFVKGRTTLDMKAVRDICAAAGIDLAPFKIIGEPSDRLTISLRDDRPVASGQIE